MKRRPFIMQTTQFHAPLGPFKRGTLEIWKAEKNKWNTEGKKKEEEQYGQVYIFQKCRFGTLFVNQDLIIG